jgi:hypothetical protein
LRKKIFIDDAIRAGFSGFRAYKGLLGESRDRFVHCVIRHVRGDVQRRSTSNAPITIDTHSTEKSIWPIGGITRRTRLSIGSHS